LQRLKLLVSRAIGEKERAVVACDHESREVTSGGDIR
jgi:hypothetical protein